MARRTRGFRKPRVAWMPTFGITAGELAETAGINGIEFELDVSPAINGDVVWDATGLTFDTSESAVVAQGELRHKTLQDIVSGNEWRLRRIVGKAFITSWMSNSTDAVKPALDVALGFIVCKTYDDGEPLTDFNEVNPLAQESMEDPWIWRRRWLLHPWGRDAIWGLTSPEGTNGQNRPETWGLPASNTDYGSVADGPHIDAKTARVIHRSERLFAVLAARQYFAGGDVTVAASGIRCLLDYRLLGSLRATKYGNRGNTSR